MADAIVCPDAATAAQVVARIDAALGLPRVPTLADVKGATGRVQSSDLSRFATTTHTVPLVHSDGVQRAVVIDTEANDVLAAPDAALVTKNVVFAVQAAPGVAQVAVAEEVKLP